MAAAGRQPVADVTVFWEVIGLRPEQFDERLAAARAHLARAWPEPVGARAGLSPHAPYSVHPLLLTELVRLAAAANVPRGDASGRVARGTGAFGPWQRTVSRVARRIGRLAAEDVYRGGRRPLDYLQRLAEAPRALVIHGNYLDAEEIDFLAVRAATMSVVFCPRTHAYFAHERYPLARMLARGVNVALGTDSRASNPDLEFAGRDAVLRSPATRMCRAGKMLELATTGRAPGAGNRQPGRHP